MAHDWQRYRLANNVTKVTEQGWAGRRNMASRYSIPQIIHVGERNREDEGIIWRIQKSKDTKKKRTRRKRTE